MSSLLILTAGTGTAGKHSDVAQGLANTIRHVRPRKFWLVPSGSHHTRRHRARQRGHRLPFSAVESSATSTMKTIDINLTDEDYDTAVALGTERGQSVEDFLRFVLNEIAAGRLPEQKAAASPKVDRLKTHSDRKPPWSAPDFDPTQPVTEDEWPEEFR